jgi:hypothetical protein
VDEDIKASLKHLNKMEAKMGNIKNPKQIPVNMNEEVDWKAK